MKTPQNIPEEAKNESFPGSAALDKVCHAFALRHW
jgi:hypothetical protein